MIERNYDNIPKELKGLKQWVCWKAEKEIDKEGLEHYSKRLINPYNGKWAKVSEPRDWAFFSIAKKTMEKYSYDGVALCLTNIKGEHIRNDIFCIDLDKVLYEPQSIDFTQFESSKIYEIFKDKTYIEYSMSGKGLHILGYGNLENNSRKRKDSIEMYDCGRFMSLTGVKTPGSTNTLQNVQDILRTANKEFVGAVEPISIKVERGAISETDAELIDKIRNSKQGSKFSDLFDRGCITGDESADDFALCRILAFWTRNDASRIDAIFRLSALMRPKWDKVHGSQTYGQLTISNAIAKGSTTRNGKEFSNKLSNHRQIGFFDNKKGDK